MFFAHRMYSKMFAIIIAGCVKMVDLASNSTNSIKQKYGRWPKKFVNLLDYNTPRETAKTQTMVPGN